MRPVNKGAAPQVFYKYQDAKHFLIDRLGNFCSYCEAACMKYELEVEHIQPKSKYPAISCDWDNILLACRMCNAIKGDTDVPDPAHYVFPDRDNTFLAIIWGEGGIPTPNTDLPTHIQERVDRTIRLIGLDRTPGSGASRQDTRWSKRMETQSKAQRAKDNLRRADSLAMRDQIQDTIVSHFSIWLSVFRDDPDMCRRIFQNFPGTSDCLQINADGNLCAIPRAVDV